MSNRAKFVENLAWAKSREAAPVLQRSVFWPGDGGRACCQFLVVALVAGSLTSARCDLSRVDGVPPYMADPLEVH